MKILVIEDEKDLRESIVDYLSGQDYLCETASDYFSAVQKIFSGDYDCILLDISLQGGCGLKILSELKKENKNDGVLIISAKGSLEDKIEGLNLGADDYLAKPFHLSELNARIAAIIRRKNFSGNSLLRFEDLTVDTMNKAVFINESPVELTRKEFELLLYFISNKNRIISKDAIAEHLWGVELYGNSDFIYTHIKNLRRKLLEAGNYDYIKSIYGMGYKFTNG